MILNLKRDQNGETIMEVMICLAILGFTLVTSFALANKNQTANLSAHERSEATKVLEQQMELLRAYTKDVELPSAETFCLKDNGTTVDKTVGGCTVQNLYKVSIIAPLNPSDCGPSQRFRVVVNWDSLNKPTDEELFMNYTACNKVPTGLTL